MTLDLTGDRADLLQALVDIESESGHEGPLADAVAAGLSGSRHLELIRDGDAVIARTHLGRDRRIVIAGHLDTVPVADNLPSRRVDGLIYGRGSADMKGGVAVALSAAVALAEPQHDLTWIFYDHEEVEASKNGLGRVARNRPELLAGDFAVLMEPTGGMVEGGCQGTLRFTVTVGGVAAHSARSWLGKNAIHQIAPVLTLVADYQPRTVLVEGLEYREGLNAVAIAGGIASNVIPDACQVTINFRFAPDRSLESATEYCRALFSGYELQVTDGASAALPGLDRPEAAAFVAAAGGAVRAKYGWTDVARFAELGIPAVNYGPADPGQAHSDDECCPVADLEICYETLVRWLY
ncbi:MAG: succinyl-diaminopimelate desuccinylase [Propioniciclava sp.]